MRHSPFFPFLASLRCSRGPSLEPGCVVPAVVTTTTPSDTLTARCDFPFGRLYASAAPDDATSGPTRASPVLVSTFCPCRSPYPEEFFGACASRSSAPSVAFAVVSAARHSLVPLQG